MSYWNWVTCSKSVVAVFSSNVQTFFFLRMRLMAVPKLPISERCRGVYLSLFLYRRSMKPIIPSTDSTRTTRTTSSRFPVDLSRQRRISTSTGSGSAAAGWRYDCLAGADSLIDPTRPCCPWRPPHRRQHYAMSAVSSRWLENLLRSSLTRTVADTRCFFAWTIARCLSVRLSLSCLLSKRVYILSSIF